MIERKEWLRWGKQEKRKKRTWKKEKRKNKINDQIEKM